MIKAQKGTKDILPDEISNWQKMENKAVEIFSKANVKEIRTPIFEATELFQRGVGDSTDIVNKEMYTFEKADRSITLRPENTAGVVRAFIENGMHRLSVPVKLWYKGPMFRYERPQAGRQRQFNQLGVEIFGIEEASADVEAIMLAVSYLKALGLNDLEVEINSLGCSSCRSNFKIALKSVIKPYLNELCEDCKKRYEINPLRILDCKNEECIEILSASEIQKVVKSDFICDDCSNHFSKVLEMLDVLKVKYKINKQLVRGLDYYNRTVFEIKSNNLGSQNAVCGGGRYDGLVEMLGGEKMPAVGFAMGMERLNSLLENVKEEKIDIFVVSTLQNETYELVSKLREEGYSVDFDFQSKKFKKQLEKASKLAKYAIILGEDEVQNNILTLKNLSSFEQEEIKFEDLVSKIK